MLNQNLTKEEAQWLLTTYAPKKDGIINGNTISLFTKAINLMRGTNNSNPTCGCQYKSQAAIANSLFDQYKSEIDNVANAV